MLRPHAFIAVTSPSNDILPNWRRMVVNTLMGIEKVRMNGMLNKKTWRMNQPDTPRASRSIAFTTAPTHMMNVKIITVIMNVTRKS